MTVRFEEIDVSDLMDWLIIYNTNPLNTHEIIINNNTNFQDYRADVMNVLHLDVQPIRIIWNLLDLTRLPYEHFYPQIKLMSELKDIIWKRLYESCIIVRNNAGLVSFLRMLFSVYTPQRSVVIIAVKGDVNNILSGYLVQMKNKSVPTFDSIWL